MKSKRVVAIYVRVSTVDQGTAMQEAELRESAERRGWEAKLYRDHGQSGARESRPALNSLLHDVRRGRIAAVMVWSLDRIARSLRQLLEISDELQRFKVDMISLNQNIDTTTASGRFAFVVLSAVSELEREMLRERVRAGVAQAKRAGKRVGRPPLRKFDASETKEIQVLRHRGASIRRLAIQYETTQYIIAKLVGPSENHSLLGGQE